MIAAPDTKQGRDGLRLAIEQAFFLPGSAAHIALAFSTGGKTLHASDVMRIWAEAKDADPPRLPRINRPHGGPKDRESISLEDRA